MHPKRRARELAIRVLFLWDAADRAEPESAEEAMRAPEEDGTGLVEQDESVARARGDALQMAQGTWEQLAAIDRRLEFHAPQWPVKRQPGVDRAILRLAVWELSHTTTPAKVTIFEAIELAKRYGSEDSPAFVNGVLDAIHRENVALSAGVRDLPAT